MKFTHVAFIALFSALAPSTSHGNGEALAQETPPTVEWFQGAHMSALGKARKEKKMLALYFWMEGSAQCTRMYSETWQAASVAQEAQEMVCLGVDIAGPQGAQLLTRYGVTTLPTVLFVSPETGVEDVVLGFAPEAGFVHELQRVRSGTGTVSAYRAQVEAAPADLALKLTLALKLLDVGAREEHDELLAEIRNLDPNGESPAGARLLFLEARDEAIAGKAPAEVDLEQLYAKLERLKVAEVRFEAWEWVAGFEAGRGNNKLSRDAARRAWEDIPQQRVLNWGGQIARQFWLMREELDGGECKFALELAELSLERTRSMQGGQDDGYGNQEWEAETYEQFLAMALDTVAMCASINGQRKRAIELGGQALELWPENEEFATRLELYRSGR